MRRTHGLEAVVGTLVRAYGPPVEPPVSGPFEMILWENVAYLVDDERRERAFRALKTRVGTTPEEIAGASDEALLEVARLGGMRPDLRVDKLKEIARIAIEECGGDLEEAVRRPESEARRILRGFPGIGEPGAEKILMMGGRARVLALESNSLRVLLRLGFGEQKKSYAATYRSVREAATAGIVRGTRWLTRAHHAMRRHGRTVCRASDPACEVCPLADRCRYNLAAER